MLSLLVHGRLHRPLNESPSEKEGKFATRVAYTVKLLTLNESPSEKEGKSRNKEQKAASNPPQ